jgi:hypothetical protein
MRIKRLDQTAPLGGLVVHELSSRPPRARISASTGAAGQFQRSTDIAATMAPARRSFCPPRSEKGVGHTSWKMQLCAKNTVANLGVAMLEHGPAEQTTARAFCQRPAMLWAEISAAGVGVKRHGRRNRVPAWWQQSTVWQNRGQSNKELDQTAPLVGRGCEDVFLRPPRARSSASTGAAGQFPR